MIGSRLFARKAKIMLFLVLYGVLGTGGLGMAALFIAKGQQVPAAAGFMFVFGTGMSVLTWLKGRKPLVVVREEFLELAFQRRPEFVVYKNISNVTRTQDNRLVVSLRDGHSIRNSTIWLRELEAADAERLATFLLKKEWKRKE
jgi:hypothetical protein